MVWFPAVSAEVVKVATPPLSVPVPSVLAPSLKVTVPVAVPDPGEATATVAVNVTDCPNVDGLLLDESTAMVLALLTT